MRTDVKLGFTIGGVLLAVLIVYVMVISGPPETPAPVSLATDDAPAASIGAAADTSVSGSAETIGDPFGASTSAAAEGGSPPDTAPQIEQPQQQAGDDRWSAALASGRLPPMMSQTPAPQHDAPAVPVPAQANQPTSVPQGDSQPSAASNTPAAVNFADLIQPGSPSRQPAAGSDAARTHVVQNGETFASIAQDVYGNAAYYPHLMRANSKIDPRKLKPGMTIEIPPTNEVRADGTAAASTPTAAPAATDSKTQYQVQSGDSLYKISMKLYGNGDSVEKIYELNKSTIGPDRAKLKIGMVLKLPEQPTR